MGQTSTEAKRQVEETREHLDRTLQELELTARRRLDLRHQLMTNRAVQAGAGLALLSLAAAVTLLTLRRRRLTPAERLVRRLKLDDLRDRLGDFSHDAGAWATAQRRILRADRKGAKADPAPPESIPRRLVVAAAQAALTAAATGLVRRLVSQPESKSDQRTVVSKHR
jgi:hypothetical protein